MQCDEPAAWEDRARDKFHGAEMRLAAIGLAHQTDQMLFKAIKETAIHNEVGCIPRLKVEQALSIMPSPPGNVPRFEEPLTGPIVEGRKKWDEAMAANPLLKGEQLVVALEEDFQVSSPKNGMQHSSSA